MELTLFTSPPAPPTFSTKGIRHTGSKVIGVSKPCFPTPLHSNLQKPGRKDYGLVSFALSETAATVMAAAVALAAASALVARTRQESDTVNTSLRTCEDCSGSGICAECNGEGFVLKKLSEESAERARMASKNMATRYTAGLPKKWSYCFKCNSGRKCSTCRGTGQVTQNSNL